MSISEKVQAAAIKACFAKFDNDPIMFDPTGAKVVISPAFPDDYTVVDSLGMQYYVGKDEAEKFL